MSDVKMDRKTNRGMASITQTANSRMKGTKDSSPEALWDVRQAAQYTGMSVSWVYHAAAAARLPRVYIGSKLRFVPAELQNWVLSQRGAVPLPSRGAGRAVA